MNDFNQDMKNLLNAYNSNWDDYLALRKQFVEKYSLSVKKLQEQLNTAKKVLTEIDCSRYGMQFRRNRNPNVATSSYSEGCRVLIDGNFYEVVNFSETSSKNNREFLKIEEKATIPKRIAKKADNTNFTEMFKFREQAFLWWFDRKDEEYIPIIYAYLAGKALGVDLVKVVEGN